jgi:hypothetical protein
VPVVLIATTARLASTAQLAIEFADAGARVALLAPPGHPAFATDLLCHRITHRASHPLLTLLGAIKHVQPHLIVPCDELSVRHLHRVHAGAPPAIAELIEASLGPTSSFATITTRHDLLEVARQVGVTVPRSRKLHDIDDLRSWALREPFPWVLKADGSWAGFGVRIVRDQQAADAAWAAMRRPVAARFAFREMLLERNYFWIAPWLRRHRSPLSVQSYVDGWPANCAVACWQGEVLAGICAESVCTSSSTGPSTVARLIDNPEMQEAASRVVAALGLSGIVGFDFMIEASTGAAYMIEMNPRVTPIATVRMGTNRDLTDALLARVVGRTPSDRPAVTERDIIAFFPDTWRQDPASPFLQTGYHTVPWQQPELVRMLMRPEFRDRTSAMRLLRRIWHRVRRDKPRG